MDVGQIRPNHLKSLSSWLLQSVRTECVWFLFVWYLSDPNNHNFHKFSKEGSYIYIYIYIYVCVCVYHELYVCVSPTLFRSGTNKAILKKCLYLSSLSKYSNVEIRCKWKHWILWSIRLDTSTLHQIGIRFKAWYFNSKNFTYRSRQYGCI